ncbi:porin [Turicimonas muris]|uniref:porin n=1 Tax=Turicimonas muris TaxID=1796652 RepID=UPI001C3E8B30|nr:porin [Turicimonas muris]
MKKSLIALAVMGASSVAFAASNVTLYGVVDAGAVVSKVKHNTTKVQMKSGFVSGSRWGLKGVEELGNGYSVGFQLEQGFDVDTGSNTASNSEGKTFGRESRLFVSGNFGQLGFGRFGSLGSGAGSYTILQGWAFGTSYEDQGSWTSFAKSNSRVNNAIAYVSPSFGGFTVHAMYSNGTVDDANKWSENRHYYGLGLKYAGEAANASLIFEALDGKGTGGKKKVGDAYNSYLKTLGLDLFEGTELDALNETKAEFKDRKTAYNITAGGSYNFGVATAMGIYQYAWESDMYSQHAFGLSATAPLAGGTAKLGARFLLGELDGTMKDAAKRANLDTKYRAWNIDAGYTYPLSKRTYVYGFAGYSDGSKLYANVENGKYNGWSVGTGLVHKF